MLKFEVHYTRIIEAKDFFDAVDKTKKDISEIEEIVAIQPWIEEPLEDSTL